jgi:hypothetical protein
MFMARWYALSIRFRAAADSKLLIVFYFLCRQQAIPE